MIYEPIRSAAKGMHDASKTNFRSIAPMTALEIKADPRGVLVRLFGVVAVEECLDTFEIR